MEEESLCHNDIFSPEWYGLPWKQRKTMEVTQYRYTFLQYSQSYPHDLSRMTSLSSTGGWMTRGWMTSYTSCFTRKVIMTSQASTPKQQLRRARFSNFSTFTPEKYLFGTYRRKIINIYCLLVTEKSTNPHVKLTCPGIGKPRHGLS